MSRRLLIALVLTGVVAAGCGAEPGPPTTSGSGTTTNSSPASEPVKYAFDAFKSCPEIRQEVGDLPPPLPAEPLEAADRYSLTCTFTTSKNNQPLITFQVELYGDHEGVPGADRAASGFSLGPAGAEATDVDLGSAARWADRSTGASCRLEFLDENAVMITSYHSGATALDPRSEECRRGARDFAKRIHDAVQP
ncbi:hypothetical protein ACQPYE_18585 [Actinosynnema sp. CA-299493]